MHPFCCFVSSQLLLNTFAKNFKEKTGQSQLSHQQKSKDTKPLSFLEPFFNNRTPSPFESLDDNSSRNQTEISDKKTASLLTDTGFEDFLRKRSNSLDKNQLRSKDVIPGVVDSKMSKGKDSALPQAAQDGSNPQVWNQSRKGTTEGMPAFKARGSGDAPPAQLHGKISPNVSEATYQPSHSDNSIPHSGYMVCIQNLPTNSNPALIKASMTIYGEVAGLFKKTRNDNFHAYIQFKVACFILKRRAFETVTSSFLN